MSRTVDSDAIQGAFLDSLRTEGGVVESMSDVAARVAHLPELQGVFKDLGRAASNVFFVKGVGLINIHVRTDAPGWWNIQKSIMDQLDYLQERGVKRYFIFLIGREDENIADGYIVSDFSEFIRAPSNEETSKFTIREKQHLDPGKLVLSARKLTKELLGLGKGS